MSSEKELLRKEYKQRRKELSREELERLSLKVFSKVEAWLATHDTYRHFHLFFPIQKQKELNTYPILELLQREDKTVYTSRVIPGKAMLETLVLPAHPEFEEDDWGIPVPKDAKLTDPDLVEVVFVPLLAFDEKGNRIGFGKGYYDVFLSSLDRRVCKVGLSVFPPEGLIPTNQHDVPLDFCITPEKVFTFSQNSSF
ncbi:5-formyltetrahydrofolate cyclo-ligase [Algoriphagus sp. CAU 1675]|uniref:5-formyltetrahydrofolate cyclo-ligase n=1 Tax=Algoriphagus sp. CAU 1675 TaxID=3032597 RepID=UPI0023DB8A22|nr:5-formyltetrahydrofolate cyclo-ligase [Algoriphagus sp. CAU 1675]MDF2156869.1 5-formyltetrahydrofolate cyclo-ligase [Algoriphagus sp. CAU 1675]